MNPSATASMHKLKKTFPSLGGLAFTAAMFCLGGTVPAADQTPDADGIRGLADRDWILPEARLVELGGSIGKAYRRGVERLSQDPYRSAAFLRSDFSFEQHRVFTKHYDGMLPQRSSSI